MSDQYRIPVLEAFPWQEQVIDNMTTTPPSTAQKGDRYVVPLNTPSTSPWFRERNHIAWHDGSNWQFDLPAPGWIVWVDSQNNYFYYNGANWVKDKSAHVPRSDNVLYVTDVQPGVVYDITSTYGGSITNPFSSINDAVQFIIDRGDNSLYNPYCIVIFPGVFLETITLESSYLVNIRFVGLEPENTIIRPSSGHTIFSNSNNNGLQRLGFNNLTLENDVFLSGESDNTHFCTGLKFNNCIFTRDADLTIQNANCVSITDTLQGGDINLSNVSHIKFFGKFNQEFCLDEREPAGTEEFNINNNSTIKPITWQEFTSITIENCFLNREINFENVGDTTTYVNVRLGGVLGSSDSANTTIPNNVFYNVINGALKGNYHCNGCINLINSIITGNVTGNGCFYTTEDTSHIYTSSEIPGTTLKDALIYFRNTSEAVEEFNEYISNALIYDTTLKDMMVNPINEI